MSARWPDSGPRKSRPASLPARAHPPWPSLRWAWLRALARIPAAVRYGWGRLFRYDRRVIETIAGQRVLVLPQVFNPKLLYSGAFFAEALGRRLIPPGSSVLDLGTGSGVCALFAARWAGRVTAVDVNPAAVRCARINARWHKLRDRIEVLSGDLFSGLGRRRFDVVCFNPPFFSGPPRSWLDHAWRSPDVLPRFAEQLPRHLTPSGRALVVLSSVCAPAASLEVFYARGYAAEKVAERRLGYETLALYRLRPPRRR